MFGHCPDCGVNCCSGYFLTLSRIHELKYVGIGTFGHWVFGHKGHTHRNLRLWWLHWHSRTLTHLRLHHARVLSHSHRVHRWLYSPLTHDSICYVVLAHTT